jgi:DNA-directed RNA polymerase subunit RPC12/RpoP
MSYLYVGEDHNECLTCGGPLRVLGQLGYRIYYRCRDCGYECIWKVEDRTADAAWSGTVH